MTTSKQRAPGWWYPWLFIGGMGVVVAVNAVLVYFALGSWTGLETDNYYRRGIQYNDAIAAAEVQRARGWQGRLDVAETPAEGRLFDATLTLKDKAGKPLDGVAVRLEAERPTDSAYDAKAPLRPLGQGRYAGRIALALPGQWALRVVAQRDSEQFQSVERVLVR
jgi:nitrogen fixation protein FixH